MKTPHEKKPGEFRVRAGTTDDVQAMTLVWQRAHAFRDGKPLPENADDQSRLSELQERMQKPDAWSFLLFSDEKLAGFVMGHPSISEESVESEKDTDYLALLMTEPDYWGSGVGSKLLDIATDHVASSGRKHLILETEEDNTRARQLYERKGYYPTTGKQLMSKNKKRLVYYRYDVKGSRKVT